MQKCLCGLCVCALCFAVLFSVPARAEGVSIDGYIQPAEWEGALFTTLFTSGEESGCRVSYADMRAMVDTPSHCVYFALQVIDESFAGAAGQSRAHIKLGNTELAISPDGEYQLTGNGYTVQAAGFYQAGGYNRDYVLEACMTRSGALPDGRLPVLIWFTDGEGRQSRRYELTLDTGAPGASSTTAPEASTEASTAAPPSSVEPAHTSNQTHPVASTGRRPGEGGAATGSTTRKPAGSGQVTAADHMTTVRPQGDSPHASEALGGKVSAPGVAQPPQGAYEPVEETAQAAGEPLAAPMETVPIPATGETGAGQWSAKRIAACVAAGSCILAAALLLVFQTRKREKADAPSKS